MTTTITRRAATDTTWKDYGTCASIGPLDPLWFPEKRSGNPAATVRGVCHSCPVQYECLTTALATPHTQHRRPRLVGREQRKRPEQAPPRRRPDRPDTTRGRGQQHTNL